LHDAKEILPDDEKKNDDDAATATGIDDEPIVPVTSIAIKLLDMRLKPSGAIL
jgi:hypothetical protein